MAPLAAVVEGINKGEDLSKQDTLLAVNSAVELIGNANARISHLWREKITSVINKTLLPIV